MDFKVAEEDVPEHDVALGFDGPLMPEDEQKKMAEAFGEGDTPVTEQAPADEIKAEDLEEEKPQGRKIKVKLPEIGEMEIDETEAANGYMRQADYTRKTQELSRKQAEIEAREAMLRAYQQPVYEQPRQTRVQVTEAPQFASPMEETLWKKAQEHETMFARLEAERKAELDKRAYAEVDDAIREFKGAHSGITEDQVTAVMARMNARKMFPSREAFEDAYKVLYFDEKSIREDERKKFIDEIKKKKSAALAPATSKGTGEPPKVDVTKMSDDERYALMVKDIQGFFK